MKFGPKTTQRRSARRVAKDTAKHSKGPWTVGKPAMRGMYAEIRVPTRALATYHIETVDGFGHGTSEANANLIAAAPDLLEACQQALSQMRARFDYIEPDTHEVSAMKDMEIAIAKAERGE